MVKTLNDLKFYKGKVRNVYFINNDKLLIVSTDRISAFDYVLPNEIPGKGKILNKISLFWFEKTKHIIKNHIISSDLDEINRLSGLNLGEYYKDRTVLVYKAKRIDFECIVRGYIVGNAWKEYEKNRTICNIKLSEDLKYAQKLNEPIFTPTTKSDLGHDENVDFEYMANQIGVEIASKIKNISLKIYKVAYDYLLEKGIILADTKFEFGFLDDELILIDEIITPDSSRFWDKKTYEIGKEPHSFDKQYVRNWLLSSGWDKKSNPPLLPEEIVVGTQKKYNEIMKLIINKD
ncbi:MAG: phosphoribosylaminoimidazolesuccinocarboxamide synthase [Elusimicrobiota bacterium]